MYTAGTQTHTHSHQHHEPLEAVISYVMLQDYYAGRDQEKHSCLSSVVQIFGCMRGPDYRGSLVMMMWPHRPPHITAISAPHLSLATALISGPRRAILPQIKQTYSNDKVVFHNTMKIYNI